MAATADRDPKRAASYDIGTAKVKASTTIYAGTLVVRATTGLVEPLTDAASKYFAGVAKEKVVGNASGTSPIDLWKRGVFEFIAASADETWCGKTVFGTDDQTVGLYATPTNKTPVGKVVEYVTATKVRVDIGGYADGHTNAYGDS